MPIAPGAVPSIGAKIADSIDPDRSKRRNLLDVATDFLSTGNYAGAGFVSGFLDALDSNDDNGLDLLTKPLEGALHGVQAGFTGESPVRYGDVLRKMGAPDKVAGIGGLVGDVLLDPLNFVSFFSPTKLGHAAELYTALKKAGTLDHVLAGGGDLAKMVEKLGGREAADLALTQGHTWVDKFHKGQMALAGLERPTLAGGKLPFVTAGDLGHLAAATRPGQAVMKSAAGPAFKAMGDALKYVPIGWKTTPFASSEAILPRLQGSFIRSADLFLKSAREDIPGVSHVYQAIGKALVPYFRPKEAAEPYGWNIYSNITRHYHDVLRSRNIAGDDAIRELMTDTEGPMGGLAEFLVRGGMDPKSPEITFLREHAAVAMKPEDQAAILASLQRPYHTNVAGDTDRRITAIFGGLTPQDVRQYADVDPQRFSTARAHLGKAIDDTRAAMRLAPQEEQAMLADKLNGLLERHNITFGATHETLDNDLYDLLNQKPEEFSGAMQQRIEYIEKNLNDLRRRQAALIQWHKDQKGRLMPGALKGYVDNLNGLKSEIADHELALAAHHDLGSRVEELRLTEAERAKARVDRAKQQVAELRGNALLQGVKAGAIPKYASEAEHLTEMMARHGAKHQHDGAALSAEMANRIAEEPLVARATRLAQGDPEEELRILSGYLQEARVARREARLLSKQQQTEALAQAGVFDRVRDRTLVMINGQSPEGGPISIAQGATGEWEAIRFKQQGKQQGQRIIGRYATPEAALGELMDQGYVFDPAGVQLLPEGLTLSPGTPLMTRERAHREIGQLARRRHGNKVGRDTAEVMRRLIDYEAARWAEKTGRNVNEYYAMRMGGVSANAPGGSAFFQYDDPLYAAEDVVDNLAHVPEQVAAAHHANEGSSIHPTMGDLGGTDHIAVSMHPELGEVIGGREVTPEQIRAFANKHRDLLEDGRHFIGTWYDKASNQSYVDVSMAVPDLIAARQIGERANQKALFDLKTFKEIPLSGTGTAGGSAITKDELDQIMAGAASRRGTRRVVRFGRPGMAEIDPENPQVRNGTVPGAEDARRASGAPAATNWYTHRSAYEQKVTRSAASRYSADVAEHRLYNLGEDPLHFLADATKNGAKTAEEAVSAAEHALKQAGFAGYINPNGGLPGGVVMLERVGPEHGLREVAANARWEKDLPEHYGALARDIDPETPDIPKLDERGRPILIDPLTSDRAELFTSMGVERGDRMVGPGEKPVAHDWVDPDTGKAHSFSIPGGAKDGKFTLWDLSHMANQGVDIRSLYKSNPELVHDLYRKMGRSLHVDMPTDEQVFNRITHSILSVGTKLRMNQIEMTVFRAIDRGDIEKMAALWRDRPKFQPGKKGDGQWAAHFKAEFSVQSRKKGGLGFPMKPDQVVGLGRLADDFLKDPAWYRKRPDETMTAFITRLETTVHMLGAKTGSWAAIPQDMIGAMAAAFDTHMVRNSWDRVFTKADVLNESKRMVAHFNGRIKKYNAKITPESGRKLKKLITKYQDLTPNQIYEYFAETALSSRALSVNGPNIPEALRGIDWGTHLPADGKIKVMSEFYSRMLNDIAAKGAKNGLSASAQQWLEWDLMRNVFEPHHHFHPSVDAMPRMSNDQIRDLMKRGKTRIFSKDNRAAMDRLLEENDGKGLHPHPNQDMMFQQGRQGPRGAVSIADDGRRWLHIMKTGRADTWAHEAFHLFQDHVDPKILEQFDVEKLAGMFERYIATGRSPVPELQPVFDQFGGLVRKVTRNGEDVPLTVRTAFDNLFAGPDAPIENALHLDVPNSREAQIRSTWGQTPGRHLNNVSSVIDQHLNDLAAYNAAPSNVSPVTKERLLRHGQEIRDDLNAVINTGQAPAYPDRHRARAQQLLERVNRAQGQPLDLLPAETRQLIEPRRVPPRSAPLVPEDRTFEPLPPAERITDETARRNLQKPRELQPLSQANQLSNEDLLREGDEHYASYVTMLRRMAQDPATGVTDQRFLQSLLTERFAQSPELRRATAAEIAGDIIRLDPGQQHRRVAIETLVHHLLETEASRGMLVGVTQNYVPRYRIQSENGGWIAGSRGVKVDRKSFERARGLLKDHPLEAINDYARAIGLKDVYDERLPEVLGMRVKDHNVAITQHDFLQEVVGQLGVRIDAKMARSSRFMAHQVMEQLGMDAAQITEARGLAEQLHAWGVAKDGQNLMIGRGIENLYRTGKLDAPLQFRFHVADRIDPMRLRGVNWDDARALKARVDQVLNTTPQDELVKAVESFQSEIKRTMERYHAITPEVGIYTSRLSMAGTNIDDNNFLDALNLFAETPYRGGNHLLPLTPDQMKSARALREDSVFILPKAIADDLNKQIAQHGHIEGEPGREFLKLYDKVLGVWKKLTLYIMPQFHTRNAVTNVINSTWHGGLKDFEWYENAGRLQLGHEFEFVDKGGREWNRETLMRSMQEHNVTGGGHWDPEEIAKSKSANPLEVGAAIGSVIENNARMALYLDGLNQGMSEFDAAIRMKKYLFDYAELTDFEKNVLRRMAPFYTWMRKNIPLQIEQLVTRPFRYGGQLRAAHDMTGILSGEELADRDRAALPAFMQKGLPVRHKINPDGSQEVFLMGNWLPLNDLANLTDPGAMAYGAITPVKGFFEAYVANWNPYFDRPVERYPGETQDFLGIRMGAKERYMFRNLRILNELDKTFKEGTTVRGRVAQLFLGKSYTVDMDKARQQRLRDFRAQVTSLQHAMKKEEAKDRKSSRIVDIGAQKSYFQGRIAELRRKMGEVR